MNRTALGFNSDSYEHLYALEVLLKNTNTQNEMKLLKVQLYLGCRSLELSLKANLSLAGIDKKTIKNKYGHDIGKIARNIDLQTTRNRRSLKLLDNINKHYKGKYLEYRNIGYRTYPLPQEILTLARAVYQETDTKIRGK